MRPLVTLLFSVSLFTACPKPAETQRVAVIDIQRAVKQSKSGLAAQERLKKRFDESQSSLDKEQAQLKTELAAGDAAANAKLMALQQRFASLQQELKDMETAEVAPLMVKVGAQLEIIARTKQLDVVLDVQSVPWMKPELDVTDDVVRALDAAP